jgi:hypothetical protein
MTEISKLNDNSSSNSKLNTSNLFSIQSNTLNNVNNNPKSTRQINAMLLNSKLDKLFVTKNATTNTNNNNENSSQDLVQSKIKNNISNRQNQQQSSNQKLEKQISILSDDNSKFSRDLDIEDLDTKEDDASEAKKENMSFSKKKVPNTSHNISQVNLEGKTPESVSSSSSIKELGSNEINRKNDTKINFTKPDQIITLNKPSLKNMSILNKASSSIDDDKTNLVLVAPLASNNKTHNEFENEEGEKKLPSTSNAEANNYNNDINNNESNQSIDLSMFTLLEKTSKKFCLRPATIGLSIRCQIYRQKGLYPKYRFYLENLDGNLLLLMTARKKKKTKTPCYVINTLTYDLDNVERYIETPIAKLKSNLLGTYFRLYDFGIKPQNNLSSSLSHQKRSRSTHSSFLSLNNNSSTNSNANETTTNNINNNNNNTSNNNANSMNNLNASLNIKSFKLNKQDSELSSDNYDINTLEFDRDVCRKEYLSVFYEFNMLGFKVRTRLFGILPSITQLSNIVVVVVEVVDDMLVTPGGVQEKVP